MTTLRPFFWLPLTFVLILFSCSTSKKSLLNQEYHSLVTKYNVLFNGKEAFSVGEEILSEAFEDNFYALLPIEPINLKGENIDESTIIPGFDRAEEKAVKAIQKHSIKINDLQYNRKIDEAYLLLGKARYFDRRFFPALEAFNFLLESGANQNVYLQGKIWREKTNIRLKNHQLAINNLRPLAMRLIPQNKHFPLANATLASAFINLKEIDSASFYMKRAALKAPKRKLKARYLFITGQLFESQGKKDSALWAYQEIVDLKRKSPPQFSIHAKIKKTLLDSTALFEDRVQSLSNLIKNFENLPYEHVLNRSIGTLYLEEDQDSVALIYFEKSLQSPSIDFFTQIENYQDLAEYNFEKGNYLETGLYLKKLLPLYEETSATFKKLKRKSDNLSEVIIYERTLQQTDSLISLMSLSKMEQLQFFKRYINEQQSIKEKNLEKQSNKRKSQFQNNVNNAFYFYNPRLVLKGQQTYKANWGDRPNVDNWRQASVIQNALNNTKNLTNRGLKKTVFIQQTPESYVEALPQKPQTKDSIININQKAYLQLGMIYKEKFGDFPLATSRLETLLSIDPPKAIAVQALYHLYKMNENEFPKKALIYKERLIEKHPESTFAMLLSDPENYDTSGVITPEKIYQNVLILFKKQDFKKVLSEINALDVVISGSRMAPKIALLKAHALGRLKGVDTWKELLLEVATNYSAAPEGLYAKELLAQIISQDDLKESGPVYKNYKWIFPFLSEDKKSAITFFEKLKEIIAYNKERWSVSQDVYSEEYDFIVVHGIRDLQEIKALKGLDSINTLLGLNTKDNFVTLSSEYRTYIKNKNWKNTSK